ncbi:toll/interleukin-1 receptor domain-containing protein [Streptomyces prunicolor]|uniref:toll/interleukin-1 receptor domain-containing protein n=1 Tax=Streptomyces prunicolor TaxID=67348 RepID=UPI00371D8539
MSAASSLPCRVVLNYARLDEAHRQTFRKHVADLERNGVHVFDDRDIPAGVDWESVLFGEMERADIIVLLLTPNFVASKFCMDSELPIAERRWRAGECRLFPVNVAPFDVAQDSFLGRLQRTPSGRSLTEYRAAAPKQWREVARQLRKLVEVQE